MGPVEQQVTRLLEPTVSGLGYELWGVEYLPQSRSGLLRLYIESDEGITLEDCERVSNQVSAVLDVEDPIRGSYRLEVSSPGMDRPLFKPEHYARMVGERLKLRTHHPKDGQRNFTGVLTAMEDNTLYIRMDDGHEAALAFDEIEKGHVVAQF